MTEKMIIADAHCDGPCGVYDPASARVAAEAVQSMTKKMLGLTAPSAEDGPAMAAYLNTMSRYVMIKEEEAQTCKDECSSCGRTSSNPTTSRRTLTSIPPSGWSAKLCSACKVEVSEQHAQELMDAVEAIHALFWSVKGREVSWVRAS